MIVAIDTHCGLSKPSEKLERYTLSLVQTLKRPFSPTSRLVILTRKENHQLFEPFADDHTTLIKIRRARYKGKKFANWDELLKRHPVGGRRTLADFQREKADLLTANNVDLVHFPGGAVCPLDLQIPVVLSTGDLHHRRFPHYYSHEEIERREKWGVASAFRADALITASPYVRSELHRQLGVNRHKIFVAPPPLPAPFHTAPSPAQLDELRNRLDLPAKFFLYPAASVAHKNHLRLIRAFVAAAIPDAQLILTGDGQVGSPLAAAIAELGAEFSVRLLGRVPTSDLAGLFHLATALLLPSEHESWSDAIAAAFACGCPVASSNAGGLAAQVGDAGLLFDPRDELAIEDAICRVAGDEILRRQLSDLGRLRSADTGEETFLATLTMAYSHATANHRIRKAA